MIWARVKEWLAEPVGSKRGFIKCDICGQWGRRNPNYRGVDTFVHVSDYGTSYLHSRHVIRSLMYELEASRRQ